MKLSSLVNNETLFSSDHGTIRVCPGNTSVELTCVAHNVTELVLSRNINGSIVHFHVDSVLGNPESLGPYSVCLDSNTTVKNNRFIVVTSKLFGTVMTSKDHRIAADQIECQAFSGKSQVAKDSVLISYYPIGKLEILLLFILNS